MLKEAGIGVACWLLRTKSAHAGRVYAQVELAGPSGVPVPQVALPPENPQCITADSATTVQLPASKAAEPGYRRTAPPNPSLESGPSEAGHLGRPAEHVYHRPCGQGALPLRAAQLTR
jgi:hypothetical protein